MNDELAGKIKTLRLDMLSKHWDEYLKTAADKRMSHGSLLAHIIEEEYRAKYERSAKLRLQRARIPEPFSIETYPFAKQPKLNRKMVMALYDTSDYITERRNIVWLGPTGCGKTGLATSFLINAIAQGCSGRFVTFAELIGELYRSVADHSEEKTLKRYQAYDCLLIDEIGYVEVEHEQVGLFFTLMQRRHKQKSTIVSSNLGFDDWGGFLKNKHLAAALIDRLTENSHVINMKGGVSIRKPLKAET